ncbi:MAG: DUF4007 family protein [Candidatus Desulfaltia sp.]|nr:DUF4007 family protein [Candidatus Desulfaltia sp.]
MAEKGETGHRQRLRDRFLAGAAESRSDEMLLELLLNFAIGRKDVMPLAQELIRVFGSLSRVLSASHDELCKVKGIGQSSITLLKVVDFIQSRTTSTTTRPSPPKGAGTTQQNLFENLPDKPAPDESSSNTINKKLVKSKKPAIKKSIKRKFQVSRSHLFEFNHFSRILSFLYENRSTKSISRNILIENSGLPDGQVASLISIGAAMGLIQTRNQTLTPIGLIIAKHDIFLEGQGTLEWCHYKGAGSYKNFLWFEVFNHILAEEPAMTQEGWQEYFKKKLKGRYSDKTVNDHVPKEIRFIVDAYTKRNFNKLEILHISTDDQLYRRRYTSFTPLVLTAMIYDFCAANEAQLSQVGETAVTPGSPAMVFGLDAALFRQQVEGLHDRGWLRYETTHNLDQIRLKPGFSAIEFLTAHFEDREPYPNDELGMINYE